MDDWLNREAPEEHLVKTGYPYIQWINGQRGLGKVHKVLETGGWMLPVDQVGKLETVQTVEVPHRNGSSTEAYLLSELAFAVLATRFSWFLREGDRVEYLSDYRDGARGKLHVIALVKHVSETEPMMLTLSGMASKGFGDVLKQFRKEVLGAAKAVSGRRYPNYAFWLRVKAGAPRSVGVGSATSVVTSPTPAWDVDGLRSAEKRNAALSALAVDDAVWAAAQTHWNDAQAWAKSERSSDDAPPGNGNGRGYEEPPYDDEPPPGYGEGSFESPF